MTRDAAALGWGTGETVEPEFVHVRSGRKAHSEWFRESAIEAPEKPSEASRVVQDATAVVPAQNGAHGQDGRHQDDEGPRPDVKVHEWYAALLDDSRIGSPLLAVGMALGRRADFNTGRRVFPAIRGDNGIARQVKANRDDVSKRIDHLESLGYLEFIRELESGTKEYRLTLPAV